MLKQLIIMQNVVEQENRCKSTNIYNKTTFNTHRVKHQNICWQIMDITNKIIRICILQWNRAHNSR